MYYMTEFPKLWKKIHLKKIDLRPSMLLVPAPGKEATVDPCELQVRQGYM